MEEKSKNNSKKAALIAIIAIFVGALLVAGCLLFTVKSRIVGVWSGGEVYLEAYGDYCYMTISFEENGDYYWALTDIFGNIRKTESGVWKVSNFKVMGTVIGRPTRTRWNYNPITNELSGGSWTLKKVG